MPSDLFYILWGCYAGYLVIIMLVLISDGYQKRFLFLIDIIVPFGALIRLIVKGLFYDFVKNIMTAFKKLD